MGKWWEKKWSPWLADPTSPFWRRSALGFLCKEWCESWNSSTLATSCKELTHWKRLMLGAGGEGDDRGWDGWMASLTRWTWVWVNSGSWCWTERPGVLQFMGSQRVGHDWATELNWTELRLIELKKFLRSFNKGGRLKTRKVKLVDGHIWRTRKSHCIFKNLTRCSSIFSRSVMWLEWTGCP